MGKAEEDESTTEHPAAPTGWRVFTRPERQPTPAANELKELLQKINGRSRGPAAPDEPDDTPEAA